MQDDYKHRIELKVKQSKQWQEKAENYKAHARKLDKELKELKLTTALYDKSAIEQLKNKNNQLMEEISSTRTELAELQNQISGQDNKDRKQKTRIKNLETTNAQLKEQVQLLREELNSANKTIETLNETIEELSMQEQNIEEDIETIFTEENRRIAENCEFAFFVPDFVDYKPVEKLFPKSKFFVLHDGTQFDIGTSVKGAIICIRYASHSQDKKVKAQCERYDVPYVPVNSYGTKTLFMEAINTYNSLFLES
jgi:uncharacterized phage infection (PIP) family protein YhgE